MTPSRTARPGRTTPRDPSPDELAAEHCVEASDRVPGQPAMTAFRQRLRLHQARWRDAHAHPIGSQPIVPTGRSRPVGSRLPLEYALATGANFVTPAAVAAARHRAALVEPHQSFDRQRFWAELLWAPSLAVNLFADLATDLRRADRALRRWWPDTPGSVVEVRFAHSPGRLDPTYLNSLRAFDAAFVVDLGADRRGIVGVSVSYHDRLAPETPKPTNRARNLEVAQRSGAFAAGAADQLLCRSGLAEMWLEHLLLLSMLQHPSASWAWGRYVVVHPADNVDVAAGCERYRDLLSDRSTFATITLEEVLAPGVLSPTARAAARDRYVPETG